MATLIAAVYWVTSIASNGSARAHVNAGWWIVAVLYLALMLSFLGGFSVFQTPIIPFPWDMVIAALVALGLYIYGTYSGILTEDLFVALRDMSIEVNKP
ncbi:MAG: hypothetical protein RXQ74_03775 [Caldivirga sp.]